MGRDRSALSHNFFSLRVINYHINLCSTAAAHFFFRGAAVPHSDHTDPPRTIPFSNNLLEHYLLFLMYPGGGKREGWYDRDGEHELENTLAWNCHHTAVGRSKPENSQPTLARKHTPGTQHIDPGEFVRAPELLPGLSGIPLQCSSLSSPCPIPSGSGGAGAVTGCRCGLGLAAAGCSLGCRALAPARAAAAAAAAPDDAEEEESRVRRRRMLAVMLLPWLPNSAAAPLRATAAPAPRSARTHGCRAALGAQAQGLHPGAPLHREKWQPGGWRSLLGTVLGLGENRWSVMHPKCLHSALVGRELLPCKGQTPASRREKFPFLGDSCTFIKN